MNTAFKLFKPEEITDNTFKLIDKDWMLVTAGKLPEYNTMTASWGGFGILWNKKIAFCVIRPTRYTYEFLEKAEAFTLSFFEETHRDALRLCGTKSGRDLDKAAAAGLTPAEGASGTVHFNEARLVVECKKLYYQDLDPANFLDAGIEKNYPLKDYHRMYIGEITGCYIKE